MNTEHNQYIVTLRWPSARPVPKYGQFTWNANLHRLVWRNEIAETLGQLAELVNQAVAFVKDQRNDMLFVEVVPVPKVEIPKEAEKIEDGSSEMGETLTLGRVPISECKLQPQVITLQEQITEPQLPPAQPTLAEKMEMAGLPRRQPE